ncbi:uncharacterized protein LOC142506476 [Primulina tabacum]|uniref:uncharacterized protein LOC142506476 n=1 Tax=Primulina tabacum TaxID=48773 RepID=UPI003F592301
MWESFKCFICKEEGHKAIDCPKKKGSTVGRAYVMNAEETEAEPDTNLITGIATYALLDSGVTHSFISETFVKRLKIIPNDLYLGFRVFIPSCDQMVTKSIMRNLELRLLKNAIQADLIVLPMPEFNIILGMDWISVNGASIDFRQSQKLEDVEVVKGFSSVFPEEVYDVPQDREMEFSIELMTGTVPISKPPYHLAPTEMKELKVQIQELLEKVFIRPSCSPWDALH